MKLLLFADKNVGLEVARFILEEYPSDLVHIVTDGENEIYRLAKDANVPTTTFRTTEELFERLTQRGQSFDFGVLAWWPRLIKPPILNLPRFGYVNFHPSLLPYNRGKNYNFWALVENAPYGVTLHFIDEGVDTGDIISQKKIEYGWTDNGETLYRKAQSEILCLFKETYPRLRTFDFEKKKQDLSKGSFHRASELEMASKIDLDKAYLGRDILNLLRARTFTGYPACWFEENGEKYEVRINISRVDK